MSCIVLNALPWGGGASTNSANSTVTVARATYLQQLHYPLYQPILGKEGKHVSYIVVIGPKAGPFVLSWPRQVKVLKLQVSPH